MDQMGINPDDPNKKPHKEGEVSIDKSPGKDKKGSTENLGEYVDFEEIDE